MKQFSIINLSLCLLNLSRKILLVWGFQLWPPREEIMTCCMLDKSHLYPASKKTHHCPKLLHLYNKIFKKGTKHSTGEDVRGLRKYSETTLQTPRSVNKWRRCSKCQSRNSPVIYGGAGCPSNAHGIPQCYSPWRSPWQSRWMLSEGGCCRPWLAHVWTGPWAAYHELT